MNILYASDDNFTEIMAVSILSLLETNADAPEIRFFIVNDSISEENLTKLRAMIEGHGRSVEFLPMPDFRGILGVELKMGRWKDNVYSRLFLRELFEAHPEVHKVLYLDCDTMILDSLRPLWETEVSDCVGAACLDCMSNLHKRIIAAKKTDNYVNTGMLLLNVDRWLADDLQTIVMEFIRKRKGKIEYPDQGTISGSGVSNRLRLLSPRYNLTCLAFDFTYEEIQIYRKPEFSYSKQEWEDALAHPVIVHFTSSFISVRPWFEGSAHPYAAAWREVHSRGPWADCPPRTMQNRWMWNKAIAIYRKLPQKLAVRIAGIMHAYIKPILYVITQ